jgi:hypothetical protein
VVVVLELVGLERAVAGPELVVLVPVELALEWGLVEQGVGVGLFGMAVKQVTWAGAGPSNKIVHITAITPTIPTSVTLDNSAITIATKVRFLKRKPSAMI